jgi:hypothetical protein
MCPCVLRVARHTLAVGITSPVPAPAGAAICCQFAAYWAKIPKSQRSSAHLKMNMLCKVTNRYNRHNRYELVPAGPERSRRKPLGAGASLNCPGPVITQHARRRQRTARTTRASARRATRTLYRRDTPQPAAHPRRRLAGGGGAIATMSCSPGQLRQAPRARPPLPSSSPRWLSLSKRGTPRVPHCPARAHGRMPCRRAHAAHAAQT